MHIVDTHPQDSTPRYWWEGGSRTPTHAEKAKFKDAHHSNVYSNKYWVKKKKKTPKCPSIRDG
jgi:hypothetical protein